VTPDWYQRVKDVSAEIEHPAALAALVETAGFGEVRVIERAVDVGLESPEDVVGWRLGMAHLAPWVASLPDERRAHAEEVARNAVAGLGRVEIDVLLVSGR
jgi:hypothetical protein